jgi:hypothetical protein
MNDLEKYKYKTFDISTIVEILKPYGSISADLFYQDDKYKTGCIEILTDEIPTPMRRTTIFKTDIVFTVNNRKWYVFIFCKL